MSDFNGMNGDIIRNTTRGGVTIGRVPGAPYGYAERTTLRVTVDMRVERNRRQAEYETVTHERIREPLAFGISLGVWQPGNGDIVTGGQAVSVLSDLTSFADGWDASSVAGLAELWDRWHLNDMRAACAHMDTATLVREPDGFGGERIACGAVNTCPENGVYTWGSSWLVEPLPDTFLQDLDRLFSVALDRRQVYTHPDFPAVVR